MKLKLILKRRWHVNDYTNGFFSSRNAWLGPGEYEARRNSQGGFSYLVVRVNGKLLGMLEDTWRAYRDPRLGDNYVEIVEDKPPPRPKRPRRSRGGRRRW